MPRLVEILLKKQEKEELDDWKINCRCAPAAKQLFSHALVQTETHGVTINLEE